MRKTIALLFMVAVMMLYWSGAAWANYDTPAVTAAAVSPYQVDVSWTAPGNVPEAVYGNITGYEIVRCIPSSPNLFQSIGTVASTVYTFSDITVTPGHQYMYVVEPSYQSNPAWNFVRSSIVIVPSSPTSLPNPNIRIIPINDFSPYTPQITINGVYSDHVNLSWIPFTGVSEQVYGQIEYYEVTRSAPDYPNIGLVLSHVASNICSYSDNSVVSGEQYLYSVRPMFSEEHNQPLLNIQGSSVVVIPYPSSRSGSGSGTNSSSTTTQQTTTTPEITTTPQADTVSMLTTTTNNIISSYPQVTVNNQPVQFNVAPEIKDGRTFAPVRSLAYSLDIEENNVLWDDSTNTVTIISGNTILQFTIGSNLLIINGESQEMDVAPYLKDDRTMVPLRFFAEALGLTVEWNETTQQVNINKAG